MRTTVGLLLLLLFGTTVTVAAQAPATPDEPVIEAAEVSGIALDQLSPGLRQDIEALAGARLNRYRISALAARIEAERPEVVAASREVVRPDGRVRIVFLVARISENTDLSSNINARYTVEDVEITGFDESKISRALRDDLETLVGHPLDSDEAEGLAKRLEAEQPDYRVHRRTARGTEPGRVRVIFQFNRSEESRWLRWPRSRSKFVFQEDLGWSGVLGISPTFDNNKFSLGFVWGNNDDLVEEYSGFWLRFANREAGHKRLGVSFEFSNFEQTWEPVTLAAVDSDPAIPRAYHKRFTAQPLVSFAFTRHVRFNGGVSVSELEPLAEDIAPSQRANAGVASIGYDQTWRSDRGRRHEIEQRVEAGYQLRAGTTALDSDLIYKRHFGEARYRVEYRHSTFIAELQLGRITGQAPLFERFTLGDTSTLRGWNKYEIAPAGASRMWHQSVEYRFHGFAYFFDAGSLWEGGADQKIRLSTGVGFHGDHAFVTFGVPLNADDVNGKFVLGIRF